jgi:hypothetical protein
MMPFKFHRILKHGPKKLHLKNIETHEYGATNIKVES